MKKKTKSEELIKLFHYWCGRLKLDKPIETYKDNRLDCTVCVDNWDDKNKICLKYNSRKLEQLKKFEIIEDVFHEIGHIIERTLPYDTEEQIIEAEYKAENFAFNMMKKYYAKQYKMLLKYFIKTNMMKKLNKKLPIYYKAFSRIKDYKNTENYNEK